MMANVENVQQPSLSRTNLALDNVAREFIRLKNLSDKQIAHVRAYSKLHGVSFIEAAVATDVVSRESLLTALSKQYNYPIIQDNEGLGGFSQELVVGHEPFGPAAEVIRSIRTSIVSSSVSRGIRSFAVIAPRGGQGASVLAGNLAVAFAQMAVNTLLVDANLRDPRIGAMFGANPDQEGLSDALLRGSVEDPPVIRDVLPGLSILASGGVPPNPQELLCSGDFMALISGLNRNYGVVIYNSPSAMDYGDAFVIASRIGAAIIAARQNHASFADLKIVADKLRSHQCTIVGSVCNKF